VRSAAFLLEDRWAVERRLGAGVDHPKAWLRYIDASAVSDQTLELDAMSVRNSEGDELGIVDGLVVDSGSGRALYVVVDAGWFTSRHFLVPISQIDLEPSRDALRASLTKEQIARFPGFDVGSFDELTENDIKRLSNPMSDVYEPGVPDPPPEAEDGHHGF
jgi:hypothetical protein